MIRDPERLRTLRLPSAAAPGAAGAGPGRAVAELVWFETRSPYAPGRAVTEHHRTLLFLDQGGYCVLEVEGLSTGTEHASRLARAGGVPFNAYSLECTLDNADEIRELMFPDRWNCASVSGRQGVPVSATGWVD